MKVFRLRYRDIDFGPYSAWGEVVRQRYGQCDDCASENMPCVDHEADDEVMELYYLYSDMETAHADGEHRVPEAARTRLRNKLGGVVDYRCGMDSLESLDQWFRGFWDRLVDIGFVLATLEVEDSIVEVQDNQVLYRKGDAKLIMLDK